MSCVAVAEEKQPVISHYRNNSEIEFSHIESLPPPAIPSASPESAVIPSIEPSGFDESSKNGEYPICSKGKHDSEQFGEDRLGDFTQSDWVVVDKKHQVEDVELVFGDGVTVFNYDPDSVDGLRSLLEGVEAPCIPYRVRIAGGTLSRFEGEAALKNYSEGKKGKLHAIFK